MPLQAEYYPGLRAEHDYRAEPTRIALARDQAFLKAQKADWEHGGSHTGGRRRRARNRVS